MLSRRLYDGVGESLDHRGARTLLVVKPESPRELSSALTGRLEISTATTIRHSQPAELDLVEQGGRFSPRGPTRPLPLWTSPQLSPRPAVVASVTVVSGFRDAFPAPGNVAAKRCAKSDPISLDTVSTTMTAAKEVDDERTKAEADSWQ